MATLRAIVAERHWTERDLAQAMGIAWEDILELVKEA